jgi:uncharacterized protein (UPF0335 family)
MRQCGMINNHLKAIVERIEKLEDEKSALALDIKEIYMEAKSNGFDIKILRKVIANRKKDQNKLAEETLLIATYETALGPLATTPLGQAAIKKAKDDI